MNISFRIDLKHMTYQWYFQQPKSAVERLLNRMVYRSPKIEYRLKLALILWVLDVKEINPGEIEL